MSEHLDKPKSDDSHKKFVVHECPMCQNEEFSGPVYFCYQGYYQKHEGLKWTCTLCGYKMEGNRYGPGGDSE